MKIAILGAGAWGTSMAITTSARHEVSLWTRDETAMRELQRTRINARYLAGITIPDTVTLQTDRSRAIEACDLAIVATSVAGLRSTLCALRQAQCEAPVVWLCKGFERGTAKLPHTIAQEELASGSAFGALSGPSFAKDVARGLPTAVTLACSQLSVAQHIARELHSSVLRVYSTDDLIGVEVAGAVKNVIALAAGISDGLGLGESARAALITRGLAEIARLGARLGGRMETFLGLAGAGDLLLTCTSDQSRNRKVGLALAKGEALPDILRQLGHVAEGVFTAAEARDLARAMGVEVPIVNAVCKVLDGVILPSEAVTELMRREPRGESSQ